MIRLRIVILLAAGFLLTAGGCSKNKQDVSKKDTQEASNNNIQVANTKDKQFVPKEETQIVPEKEIILDEHVEQKFTISASTQLFVTLSDTVQTNKNQAGDRFTGTLARTVVVRRNKPIKAGAKVNLVITKLIKGGTLKTPPEIGFTVESIILPDGKSYKVSASEIYQKGRSHTDREVGMIDGGAAATGRQNLIYVPGQNVTFTLMQPLTINEPR